MTWLLVVAVVAMAGVAVGFRFVGHDPSIWHADPLTTDRTGRPNDFLAGPAGAMASEPDAALAGRDLPPRELLFLFNSIASNAPRTRVIGGKLDDLHVTYVQQSALFGFPDYISVKVVEEGDGSALAIWSRSRFGYSDMGVNRDRVERWLAAMGG
ncbi:MAG: DUF1499 domain-containing protein [Pseudomonadota bacterium]